MEIRWKCSWCTQLNPVIEPKCTYCSTTREVEAVEAIKRSADNHALRQNLDSSILRFFGILLLIVLGIAFLTSGASLAVIIALVFMSIVLFALSRILDLATETARRVERLETDSGKRRSTNTS